MHSLFQMLSDLARFGALMVVFILGFALAFYSLFGSTSVLLPDGGEISNFDTYSSSLLTLFGSMLGTFDFTVSQCAKKGCNTSSPSIACVCSRRAYTGYSPGAILY